MRRQLLMVLDANVLIDYAKTDATVLALVVKHVGPVHVPSALLPEVKQLQQSDYDRLGLRVVEPTVAQPDGSDPEQAWTEA